MPWNMWSTLGFRRPSQWVFITIIWDLHFLISTFPTATRSFACALILKAVIAMERIIVLQYYHWVSDGVWGEHLLWWMRLTTLLWALFMFKNVLLFLTLALPLFPKWVSFFSNHAFRLIGSIVTCIIANANGTCSHMKSVNPHSYLVFCS